MIFKRAVAKLRAQDWTAITIEVAIVIIGVFIGMQVTNWNQARLDRAETQRLLAQFLPELDSQLEYLDSAKTYYATTRRYADQAFAGWKRDPRISDEQFVIAAYQASQITAIPFNPDSWSITFGGEQLRNIDDPKIRRNLELILTSDYSPIVFTAVSTRYREQVRHVIPTEIQEAIRRNCDDRPVTGKSGAVFTVLPPKCEMRMNATQAAGAAAALRSRPDLVGELNWHTAAVATYLTNAEFLAKPMRELQRELSASSSRE